MSGPQPWQPSAAEADEIRALRRGGWSTVRVASWFRVSPPTMTRVLISLGLHNEKADRAATLSALDTPFPDPRLMLHPASLSAVHSTSERQIAGRRHQ